MSVYVKYQNVYRIVVGENNTIIPLPISVNIDFSDLQIFTDVVKVQIFLLQNLLPYPNTDDNSLETVHKSWYITPDEFNLFIEKMFKPHIEGTKFESVLSNITRLINMCKHTCADYLSDFHSAYSLIVFEYNAKRDEVCKILKHLREILRQQNANAVGLHELQHISMMLQRLVAFMRKPYFIYAATLTILFHLPLLIGYPNIRVESKSEELSHISLNDVIINMILMPVYEALNQKNDEFLRMFINRKFGHTHNLDSLHHWYKHLLSIDRNCVKKYMLSIEKYLIERKGKGILNDDFLTEDDVTFSTNGWRVLGLLTREDQPFIIMQKRALESMNMSLTSFVSTWFVSHSLLLHLPQPNVSNISYAVTTKRMLQKMSKMTGYRAKNDRDKRLNHLTLYKFINEIANTIMNMRLFNYMDVIELFNVYNRYEVIVDIIQFIMELSPQSMGKILNSAAANASGNVDTKSLCP